MATSEARQQVLSPEECRRALDRQHPKLGRVAYVSGDVPLVFPINYALDGAAVVFRTDPNSALAQAPASGIVTFQADEVDVTWEEGWSVMIHGPAEEVVDADELDRLHHLPLRPWSPGDKTHYVRIRPDTVTGRRII
jgi:uncharacterized protein